MFLVSLGKILARLLAKKAFSNPFIWKWVHITQICGHHSWFMVLASFWIPLAEFGVIKSVVFEPHYLLVDTFDTDQQF